MKISLQIIICYHKNVLQNENVPGVLTWKKKKGPM